MVRLVERPRTPRLWKAISHFQILTTRAAIPGFPIFSESAPLHPCVRNLPCEADPCCSVGWNRWTCWIGPWTMYLTPPVVHRYRFRPLRTPHSNARCRNPRRWANLRAAWNNWDTPPDWLIFLFVWPSSYALLPKVIHLVSREKKGRGLKSPGASGERRTAHQSHLSRLDIDGFLGKLGQPFVRRGLLVQ